MKGVVLLGLDHLIRAYDRNPLAGPTNTNEVALICATEAESTGLALVSWGFWQTGNLKRPHASKSPPQRC